MANEPTRPLVTVIIPALDEERTIDQLLEALLSGTRVPDEIVVADGGSTDTTREIVASYVDRGVRLIEGPGGISENRNAAIRAATGDIIACTDAGCVPDPTWLERLTQPLEAGAEWTGGLSRPASNSPLQSAIGLAMMPSVDEVDIHHFVPGGASQAFRKDLWERVGGFPEGMRAGEDTVFGNRVRKLGIEPVIVPQAQVVWQAPTSPLEMARKAFLWGQADGSAGTNSTSYARIFVVWVGGFAATAVLPVLRLPRLAAASLAAVLGASAWTTRRKHRSLDDLIGSMALPVLHAVRVSSQGLGWITGFSARSDRPPLAKIARTLTGEVQARLGPLVPERFKARVRRRRASSRSAVSRNNFDILVPDSLDVDMWLARTPDTCRVGVERAPLASTDNEIVIRPEQVAPDVEQRLGAAIQRGAQAATLATTAPPRDRGEPAIDPIAVAVRPEALEVPVPSDTSTLQHLVRQAGLRQAIIPVSGLDPRPSRRPIGDPGTVVILGTVPMHDVGGGSRGAQMAHELVARGYHVTYLNLFESDEEVDLGLRYVHPNLDEIPAEAFDLDRFRSRLATETRIGILELPHPTHGSTVTALREMGFSVAYDLMDDWSDSALGGWGYTRWFEEEIARTCDGLVASAPSLVERLERLSGRRVELVANAVNTRLFTPDADYPMPSDLPAGEGPVLEYHGSLYGSWFDWEALERTAATHPTARVVVIGDARNHPRMPDNVHFLGLKPQHLLPGYLAHSDVAIVPFEVSETTHAVSPLKVFEYLAMEVPVASVPLEPLLGLDGVHTDDDLAVAVDAALGAERPDGAAIASAHGWGERMSRMFAALGEELEQAPGARPIHVTQRPVTHWRPDQRRI